MFQVIEKPHKYNCICNECQAKAKKDELKFAKSRLNAYKGEFIKRLYPEVSTKQQNDTANWNVRAEN